MLGEALGEVQRARAADVVALEVGQLFEEGRVFLGLLVFGGQVVDQRHQGFGDELAAERAEQPALVGAVGIGLGHGWLQWRRRRQGRAGRASVANGYKVANGGRGEKR
ncbi:hypothetical protein D3C84_1055680 [compost metagenome]